jgi:hypothetical protein
MKSTGKICFFLAMFCMSLVLTASMAQTTGPESEEEIKIPEKIEVPAGQPSQPDPALIDNSQNQQEQVLYGFYFDSLIFAHASFGHMAWAVNALNITQQPIAMPYLPKMQEYSKKLAQLVKMSEQKSLDESAKSFLQKILSNLTKLDKAMSLAEEDLKTERKNKNQISAKMKAALKIHEEIGKDLPQLGENLTKLLAP